jgi:hypothetical protein
VAGGEWAACNAASAARPRGREGLREASGVRYRGGGIVRTILSMPRGPSDVRTASATALAAMMLLSRTLRQKGGAQKHPLLTATRPSPAHVVD